MHVITISITSDHVTVSATRTHINTAFPSSISMWIRTMWVCVWLFLFMSSTICQGSDSILCQSTEMQRHKAKKELFVSLSSFTKYCWLDAGDSSSNVDGLKKETWMHSHIYRKMHKCISLQRWLLTDLLPVSQPLPIEVILFYFFPYFDTIEICCSCACLLVSIFVCGKSQHCKCWCTLYTNRLFVDGIHFSTEISHLIHYICIVTITIVRLLLCNFIQLKNLLLHLFSFSALGPRLDVIIFLLQLQHSSHK